MPFFDTSRIPLPNRNNINLWADFIERLCVFSDGYEITRDTVQDFLFDDSTKTKAQIDKLISFNHSFLNELITQDLLPVISDEEDLESNAIDSVNSKIIQVFDFIRERKTFYGSYYPFDIIDDRLKLCCDRQHLNLVQRAYLIQLFSSDLRLYDSATINELGHVFEALCKEPFRVLISSSANIKFFGSGGGDVIASDYKGNLADRLTSLAADLAFTTNPLIHQEDELPYVGDAGLDWVGWYNFEDNQNHQPVFFGQCACGANWVDKQHETSPSRWRNFLNFNQPLNCVHMMPHSYRKNKGRWLVESKIENVILLDRYRLLFLIEKVQEKYTIHERHVKLLEEAFNFRIN